MDDLLVAGANLLLNVNKPNYNVSPGKGSPAACNHTVRSLPQDDDYYYKRNDGAASSATANNCVSVSSICSPSNQNVSAGDTILPPFHLLARFDASLGTKFEKGDLRHARSTSTNTVDASVSSSSGSDSPDSILDLQQNNNRSDSPTLCLKTKLLQKDRAVDDRIYRNGSMFASGSEANLPDSPAASGNSNSSGNLNAFKPNTKKRRSPQSDVDKELLAKFRKESHSALEQRRRDKINEGINQLKELVEPFSHGKYDKASVLRKSIEYIQQAQALQRRLVEENYALRDDNGQLSACLDVVRTQNRLLRLEMTKLRPDLQQHLADEEESVAKLCAGIARSDHLSSNCFAGSDHANKKLHGGGESLDRDGLSSRGGYDRAWKTYTLSDRERETVKMHDPRAVFERLGLDRERDRDQDPLKSLYTVYTADKMQAIFDRDRDRDRDVKPPLSRLDNLPSCSPRPPSDTAPPQPYGDNGQVYRSYADEKHYVPSPSPYGLNGREPRFRHREHSHPRGQADQFSSKKQSADSNHPHTPSASSAASASSSGGVSTATASAAVMGAQGQGAQAAVSVSVTGSDTKPTFQVQSSQSDASGTSSSSSSPASTSSKASYGVQVQVQMPEGKKHSHHMVSVGTEISINVSSAAPSKAPPTTTTTEPSSPSTPQSQASTHTASRPQDREGHIGGGPPHSGNSSHATSSHPGTDQITLRSSAEVSVKVENNRRPLTAP